MDGSDVVQASLLEPGFTARDAENILAPSALDLVATRFGQIKRQIGPSMKKVVQYIIIRP